MATRVYIEAAGCDRRRLDAESIGAYLLANDYELVDDPLSADKILAVVCAFKAKEEDESVKRLRSLRAYGREILVYGCLADIAADRYEEFSDLPSVAPRDLASIDSYFADIQTPFSQIAEANIIALHGSRLVRARRRLEAGLIPWQEMADRLRSLRFGLRSRTSEPRGDVFNLFISRGCLGACTYCAIRLAIGSLLSKPADEIVSELREGLSEGYRSFHILGDDPGCWGLDATSTLPELLSLLFAETVALDPACAAPANGTRPVRFDIREIHPKYLIRYGEEIAALPGPSLLGGILCPAQSGSDRVLELMKRQHTSAELLDTLRRLKDALPGLRLDTQIIVGFPTETEEDFQRTLDFVREARFDSVVVFPYDDKHGTEASKLAEKIPQSVIDRRVRAAFRAFRRARIRAFYSCP